MLVYEIATGGRHPYHDMRSRAELDEATLNSHPIQPISTHRVPPWPDVEDVIQHCLKTAPEKRPTVSTGTSRVEKKAKYFMGSSKLVNSIFFITRIDKIQS